MTGTVAMTRFTPDAEARLEHYLSDVRAALAGASDVSPAEIEADIQAHIDAEFHAAIRPVSAGELEAVLVRLGPPEVWAVTADRSPAAHGIEPFHWSDFFANLKRRLLSIPATLWNGPEDWRLPYIAFGLFVFGIFTLPIFGLGVIFLGMSYLFGRATAELAKEKGQPLGARRWLAYPGVIAIVVPLFIALILWPLAAIPATVQEVSHAQQIVRNQEERERGLWKQLPEHPEQLEQSRRFLAMIPASGDGAVALAAAVAGVGAIAAWWTVLGLLMWAFPKWPVVVFHPLLDGYEGRHGLKLAGVTGFALFLWCGFVYRFSQNVG